jgi:predicted nucleic acid-binding protein
VAYARLDDGPPLAPSLWWFETRNVIMVNWRRGRIDAEKAEKALKFLAQLPIELDHAANESVLVSLVRTRGLTVYDAAYLELAKRRGVALATLDEALKRAAKLEDIDVL